MLHVYFFLDFRNISQRICIVLRCLKLPLTAAANIPIHKTIKTPIMSGVVCTWAASIPSSSEPWYEDEYVPSIASKFCFQALHCEVVESGIDDDVGGIGTREAPWKWFTVYETENVNEAMDATYEENNQPAMHGPLKDTRFDIRTYEEVKRWQAGDWEGGMLLLQVCEIAYKTNTSVGHADVVSVAIMEWEIEAGKEEEVLDFYYTECVPMITVSPDILRARMFKIKNATVLKAGSHETLEKGNLHTYLTIMELESEEWPWDKIVALGDNIKWREYFEAQKGVVSRIDVFGTCRSLTRYRNGKPLIIW